MKDCQFNMILNRESNKLECICKYNRNESIPCEYFTFNTCKWSVEGERNDQEG